MPEPTLVWNLAFPAADLYLVRRIYVDLEADPHVKTVSWFTDENRSPDIIQMRVEFRLGHYQPLRHELRGLDRRYPSENPPARPATLPSVELHPPPPPVLSNGFRVGDWARRKHHSAVYKILGIKGSDEPRQRGSPPDRTPMVMLVHAESKETIAISIPHLLIGYEPVNRPPNIPTWHEIILDEDPFE